MKQAGPIAIAMIVVLATIAITTAAWAGDFDGYRIFTLIAVVVVEVYIATVLFQARTWGQGDALNLIPALVAAVPVLLVSFLGLAVHFSVLVGVVVYVLGWAVALTVLLASISAAQQRERRAKATPSEPDFTIRPGSA